MSDNVGLTTPRGSGTSGYVQRNLSLLRPRDRVEPYSKELRHQQRKPDPEILEHERKRRLENEVYKLRDRLEEEGVNDDDIDDQCDALRKKLQQDFERTKSRPTDAKGLKSHQVHDLAKAKIEETEKMRRALGIREDYEEGSHWEKSEQRMRDAVEEKEGDRDRDH
ncbi:hypothetical protein P152DRAFT_508308 [Eremomyces bilateralis CBS 781.70]|uniref:CWF21 domain-containing protein n=1 Tax=Eremomyces bilateralis CBS 781.70 TaxID=1392243 RepID=A0A6G1FZI8_9PEZI|nr:uncharacterized protein P152DRAFT_508308 [Eremomyces bilateralis CBS 781.70]KAF1810979.1 hypothetical protein P152DRAFT_508308 [Eremomyces bilateralis CBS 781.70]